MAQQNNGEWLRYALPGLIIAVILYQFWFIIMAALAVCGFMFLYREHKNQKNDRYK